MLPAVGEEAEEEEKTDDEEVDALVRAETKHPFNLDKVKTHEALLEAKGWTADKLHECFKKLPEAEQQKVWKLFERSRKAQGWQEQWSSQASGPGSNKKKNDLLRGWLKDGGQCASYFRSASLQLQHLSEDKIAVSWITWKQTLKKFGKEEALARLKKGTLKYRKSKTDSRFLEFAEVLESSSHVKSRLRNTSVGGQGKGVSKKMLKDMEELKLEDLEAEDFGLGRLSSRRWTWTLM